MTIWVFEGRTKVKRHDFGAIEYYRNAEEVPSTARAGSFEVPS